MASEPVEARAPDGETSIVHVHLKVVPGASRDGVAGLVGDRLKVRVTAPPESGRANKAVLALLARTLGIAPSALRLVRGAGTPRKTIEVRGVDVAEVRSRLTGSDAR